MIRHYTYLPTRLGQVKSNLQLKLGTCERFYMNRKTFVHQASASMREFHKFEI